MEVGSEDVVGWEVVLVDLVLRFEGAEGSTGGLIVYFVVMRVCWRISSCLSGTEREGLTVVGRACNRRCDCVSHCWAVSR